MGIRRLAARLAARLAPPRRAVIRGAHTTITICESRSKYAVNGGLKSPEAHGVIAHGYLTE
jgi:hypothetical protein